MQRGPTPTDGNESDSEFPYKINTAFSLANIGGLSVENQGRVLPKATRTKLVNPIKENPIFPGAVKYSYTVALTRSINDLRDNQTIIDDYLTIAPTDYPKRLSLLIGLNEQEVLSDGSDDEMTATDRANHQARQAIRTKNKNIDTVDAKDMPILFQTAHWQANWVNRNAVGLADISDVRTAYQAVKAKTPERARKLKSYEKNRSHYPFGAMRSHLFNHADSVAFLKDMQERVRATNPSIARLYILNQDADYLKLNVSPMFYAPLQGQVAVLAEQPTYQLLATTYGEITLPELTNKTLLDRYDLIINQHDAAARQYPRFIGGGHVYSPSENDDFLKENPAWRGVNIQASMLWTRFGSELGNATKHLIGLYNPYPLYFHEPNTLFEWRGPLVKVTFGEKSEMKDYFRSQVSEYPPTAKDQAKFHASVVVETSQRRSGLPFTVKFFGTVEGNRFKRWSNADIRALQNMPQEILTANEWMSAVCTAFTYAKISKPVTKDATLIQIKARWNIKGDPRCIVARLYNLFDPHHVAYRYGQCRYLQKTWESYSGFEQDYYLNKRAAAAENIKYDATDLSHVIIAANYTQLVPKDTDTVMVEIKMMLVHLYNEAVAASILTLAKQTGELRRAMFSNVLIPPAIRNEP